MRTGCRKLGSSRPQKLCNRSVPVHILNRILSGKILSPIDESTIVLITANQFLTLTKCRIEWLWHGYKLASQHIMLLMQKTHKTSNLMVPFQITFRRYRDYRVRVHESCSSGPDVQSMF